MAKLARLIADLTAVPNERAPHSSAQDSRIGYLYNDEERPLTAREALRLLAKSWPFVREHRHLMALKVVLAVSSMGFFLLTPWPIKIVIDNVIDGRPMAGWLQRVLFPLVGDNRMLLLALVSGFLAAAAILIGMVGGNAVGLNTGVASGGLDQAGFTANDANSGWSQWNGLLGFSEVWITINLTQRINQTVRTVVYERFLRAPIQLFADQKIGDAVFRVMYDSAAIGPFLYRGVVAPLMALMMITLGLLVLTIHFSNEPLIPILAGLSLPVIGVGATLFGRPLRDQAQRMRERGSDVMAAFEERIAQVQLVKAFGQEQRETLAINRDSWASFSATLRMLAITLLIIAILLPLSAGLILAGLYHLMKQVIEQKMTLGDVVLLGSYGIMLGSPIGTLAGTWAAIQPQVAGLRRVHSALDLLDEAESNSAAPPLVEPISSIELRELSVGYDPAHPVLTRASMVLRVGELAALAGASGSGKSTLIAAIPRFIKPFAGQILVNGHAATELDLRALRAKIGFVFQQESLFSASIAYNIRYGRPDADEAAVRKAASLAGAAEFIEALPDGYQTMLGRRGARLSVGQKQRIAYARALLREPEVLILDEPTAPLDPGSEASLMRTLRAISRERIVLIVTHKPQTLAECDRVWFIDAGTVAAAGTHEELLAHSAEYRSFVAPRGAAAS